MIMQEKVLVVTAVIGIAAGLYYYSISPDIYPMAYIIFGVFTILYVRGTRDESSS